MKKALLLSLLAFSVFVADGKTARSPKKKFPQVTRSAPKAKKSFSASAEETNSNGIHAEQALLIDFDNEEHLYGKNSDERCVPSSMTKLMTIYLLFEAIAKGELKMDDELPVSEVAQSKEGSRSFFKAGTLANVDEIGRASCR
ncbi:MAG: hypothetical protein LBB12_01675, partial [Holosporaceae bacterium]|nr:hypothetical protein [Holosporaceae bacterium]